MRLGIVGPLPRPYGGISVHVQRVKDYLADRNIECRIYMNPTDEENVTSTVGRIKKWIGRCLFTPEENIIHFHHIWWRHWILASLMGYRGKKVVLTIHNENMMRQMNNSGWLKTTATKILTRLIMKGISAIVSVNVSMRDWLVSIGVDPKKIFIIPAFIPPTIRQEDISEIPDDVWSFIEKHRPIISANAAEITFYNGEDLYGIDMCVDLCYELKKDYKDIGFVFSIPTVTNPRYLQEIRDRIKDKDIDGNFLFITDQYHFYPILMKSDVFVRPTNVDGYGVSIAEALSLKIPAIASNVCRRTDGTVLFESRDSADFYCKVKDVLDNYEFYKKECEKVEIEDYADKLIGIYERLENDQG